MNLTAKILLTIYIGGRLASSTARKVNKDQKSKVITSPFERAMYDQKGNFNGYFTPKGHYLAPSDHLEPIIGGCEQKTVISEEAYEYMTSDVPEYFVIRKNARLWERMSKNERIMWHMERRADGNPFKIEYV